MTILDTLNWANEKLKKAQIDSPMLDAQVILAHILNTRKSWLFSHFNDPLKTHHEEQFILAIDRRVKHEPVAYIIGTKPFYGRTFFVNASVLIPRPATETLIEEALKCINEPDRDKTLLCDIGTGSGAIAITLALETSLPVIATDLGANALEVAKQNATTLQANDIEFLEGDLLDPTTALFTSIRSSNDPHISSVYPFKHLIICANLPYLNDDQMKTLSDDVQFEPVGALAAGADGLDAYHQLFRQLARHRDLLPRQVSVLLEIDPSQKQKAVDMITHNFPNAKPIVVQDLQSLDRVIVVEM